MQVAEAGRTREGDPNTSCTPLDSKHLVYYEQLVSSVSLFTIRRTTSCAAALENIRR